MRQRAGECSDIDILTCNPRAVWLHGTFMELVVVLAGIVVRCGLMMAVAPRTQGRR